MKREVICSFLECYVAGCVVCRNGEVDESSDSQLNPELLAVFILE